MSEQSELESERRQYQRFKVVWAGDILTNPPTECIVLDISAQGLKLRLPKDTILPDRFVVSLPGRGQFAAELVGVFEQLARVRLLVDKEAVANAVADAVPKARFLEALY